MLLVLFCTGDCTYSWDVCKWMSYLGVGLTSHHHHTHTHNRPTIKCITCLIADAIHWFLNHSHRSLSEKIANKKKRKKTNGNSNKDNIKIYMKTRAIKQKYSCAMCVKIKSSMRSFGGRMNIVAACPLCAQTYKHTHTRTRTHTHTRTCLEIIFLYTLDGNIHLIIFFLF